ncbi:uncharacterized protein LOC133733853 [Rosa rugosa]|uniref:uncharacterized protein LOC133733853 n=1 Tax=Rosa rugosa TaxID=74645 RepID=UPI002B404E63|nr:uncharacterized protein LOC133733853 [Rosa rugosa]
MFSILKRKCSWSMISAIASIVGLVSLMLASKVHLFFFPLVPSFEYFSQTHNSCVPINASTEAITDHFRGNLEPPIDLENHFPADLHKAVVFHGAPWKAEIGRWLAGCGSISNKVNIVEVGVAAKMTAVVEVFVIVNWDNVGAFMDIVVKTEEQMGYKYGEACFRLCF